MRPQPSLHRPAACLAIAIAIACSLPVATPAAEPLTARFITPQTGAALVVRPRQILARLPDGGEAAALWSVEAARLSVLPNEPARQVVRIVEACGFLLNEVEELGFTGRPDGAADDAGLVLVIRFSRPVDPLLVGDLFRNPQVGEVGGVRTYRDAGARLAVALVDDRSLVVGPAKAIPALLAAGAAGGPVHDAIADVAADVDLAGGLSAAVLPDGARATESLIAGLKLGRFSVRLGKQPTVEGTATFTDAAAATRGAEWLSFLLRDMPAGLGQAVEMLGRRQPRPDAGLAGLRAAVAGLGRWAGAIEPRKDGDRLTFAGTSPADAGFPADIGPLLLLPDTEAQAAELRARAAKPDDEPRPRGYLDSFVWRPLDAAAARRARQALRADATTLRLRNRLPIAAGFDAESFRILASADSAPQRDLPDQPLSLLALTANLMGTQGVLPARDRSLLVHFDRPSEVAQPFLDTLDFGFASLIRVEDVTGVTAKVEGDTAAGTISFASNTARGELRFRAVRDGQDWKFTELELPGWLMTCSRRPDGSWGMRSDRGPYGNEPRAAAVELAPSLDGKPLPDARLLVYREPQLDVFDVDRGKGGGQTARLPPGRYLVQVLGDDFDDALRADGPVVTVPAEPPQGPLAVELKALRKVGAANRPGSDR